MAEIPNVTPAEFLKHYRLVAEAKRELEKIEAEARSKRGIYRSTLKSAKKAGVNQAMLIEAHRIKTNADEAEVAMGFLDLGRYLRYLGSPLGAQFNLFDDQAGDIPASVADDQATWDAEDTGYRAGQAGHDISACPYPQGSALAQAWSTGHVKGKKVLADFAAGNPAEPVKRRGRKVRGTNAIVAGAAA